MRRQCDTSYLTSRRCCEATWRKELQEEAPAEFTSDQMEHMSGWVYLATRNWCPFFILRYDFGRLGLGTRQTERIPSRTHKANLSDLTHHSAQGF